MKRFTMTEDHLTLLRAANVSWDPTEFGAPQIDPKRPYGNSSVVRDIHELLHPGEIWTSDAPAWGENLQAYYEKLHAETETALQIVLATGQFVAGLYGKDTAYGRDWRFLATLPVGAVGEPRGER